MSLPEVDAMRRDAPPPGASLRAWITVLLLGLLYIVSFIDRLVLALMIEPIKSDLHISDVQIGLLIGSSFAVFYTLASFPLARIADTGNRRQLISLGAVTWGMMTVVSAFADSFAGLLVCRIGVGLGEAALAPAALSLISDLFPREKRSLPTSIFVMIGACGAAGAMVVGAIVLGWTTSADFSMLPFLADIAPWRLTLLFVGLPAILFAALFAATTSEPARMQPASRAEMTTSLVVKHLVESRVTYTGFFSAATITSVVNFSIFAWFPTHLIRFFDMPAVTAGLVFGGIGVAATMGGGLVIPAVAIRLGRHGYPDASIRIAIGCAVLIAPLLSAALLAADPGLALLFLAPSMFLQLGVAVLFVSMSPLLSPGMYRAQMAALFFFFINFVGFGLGPPLVAQVAELFLVGPHAIGKALAIVVLLLLPVQIALLFWSREAFCRSAREASELENALRG